MFKELFSHKKEYGAEYFSGDVNAMMDAFDKIVCQYNLSNTLTPGLRFLLKKILKPLPPLPSKIRSILPIRRFKPLPIITSNDNTETTTKILSITKKTDADYQCPKCSKVLSKMHGLKSHLNKKIPCDFKCRTCGNKLGNAGLYNLHAKQCSPDTNKANKNESLLLQSLKEPRQKK
jgi:hypothetical protein